MRIASVAALSAAYCLSSGSAFAGGCLHFIGMGGGVPSPDAGATLGMLVTAGVVYVARRRRSATTAV